MKWRVESWIESVNLWGDGGESTTVFEGTVESCIDFVKKNYPKYVKSDEKLSEILYQASELMHVFFWIDRKNDDLAIELVDDYDHWSEQSYDFNSEITEATGELS